MIQSDTQVIILAAGRSTRFRTGKTKLLEKICGQEMIIYPTKLFCTMNLQTTLVIGYQKEAVRKKVQECHQDAVTFVEQDIQRGTGHAILLSKEVWCKENILICNGDCPLITQEIIEELYAQHKAANAVISFVIAHNADPSLGGYGRVVKEADHIKIVEAKDFVGDANTNCCVNAGIYLVKKDFLELFVAQIGSNNKSNEFYFTDIVGLASTLKQPVTMVTAPFDRVRGINTLQELWVAEQIKRAELIKYWMERGVQFSVAQNVHIDLAVSIGSGSRIGCGVHLLGNTKIGNNCDVQEFSSVEDSVFEENVTIYSHCIIKNAYVGESAQVGPFAHVRDNTRIGKRAVISNFVEVKNSVIGAHTKTTSLSYVGDVQIELTSKNNEPLDEVVVQASKVIEEDISESNC